MPISHQVTAPRFQVVLDAEDLEVGSDAATDVKQLMTVADDVEAAGTEAFGDVRSVQGTRREREQEL